MNGQENKIVSLITENRLLKNNQMILESRIVALECHTVKMINYLYDKLLHLHVDFLNNDMLSHQHNKKKTRGL